MEISEKLFKEIQKLSKSEWDALRVGVDYLFASELKEMEKNTFLSPNASDKLRHCPKPISLQETESPDHGNITGEHSHGGHAHSLGEHRHSVCGHKLGGHFHPVGDHSHGGHFHSAGGHAHSTGEHNHAVVGHSILGIGIAEEWNPYLGTVSSDYLLDELHKRGEDTEKLVIAAWKEGKSPADIDEKFGDFGRHIIEKTKAMDLYRYK